MYGLYVHRDEGMTVMQGPYPTAQEAYMARAEYIMAAQRNGFKVRRGRVAAFLKARGVKLEVWVDRVEDDLPA